MKLISVISVFILLISTISCSIASTANINLISNSNQDTIRKYTHFNITAPLTDTESCDIQLELPKPDDQIECTYACNKYYVRIEPHPTNISRFYFCTGKTNACRTDPTVEFKPLLTSCWDVFCFPGNSSVKVDATYTALCVDPTPRLTSTNNSNSFNNNISIKLLSIIVLILICIF